LQGETHLNSQKSETHAPDLPVT